MGILAAIKREEKKVKKQLAKLRHKLSGLEAAAKAKIGKAAKKRWAKFRAQAKKVAG